MAQPCDSHGDCSNTPLSPEAGSRVLLVNKGATSKTSQGQQGTTGGVIQHLTRASSTRNTVQMDFSWHVHLKLRYDPYNAVVDASWLNTVIKTARKMIEKHRFFLLQMVSNSRSCTRVCLWQLMMYCKTVKLSFILANITYISQKNTIKYLFLMELNCNSPNTTGE